MPDVSNLAQLAMILKEYGGWAFSILLMIAIVCLYRATSSLLERRNSELKSLLVESKSVIAENRIFMDRVEEAIKDRIAVVKENTEVLLRVRAYLEFLRR